MQKIIIMCMILLLNGCTTTNTLVEFDKSGHITKKVILEENSFGKLMNEMKGKDIAWWHNGWFFDIEVSLMNSETYIPAVILKGGNANNGHISLTKDSKQNLGDCIKAMQTTLNVNVDTQGVNIEEKNKNE